MISHYKKKANDVALDGHPTAYLLLAFHLNKEPSPPKDIAVFIDPKENCFDAHLIFQGKKSLESDVDSYTLKLKKALQGLSKTHMPVYLTKRMPLVFRDTLENVIEKMYEPVLFMKCTKRHWSCYIFPKKEASKVQEFVNNYLRVNTYKPLYTWWPELPVEILTTRELQVPESDTVDDDAEVKRKGIVGKREGTTRPVESGTKEGMSKHEKPPLPKKPVKASEPKPKYFLLVKLGPQEVQYLYARHSKEMQDLEVEYKVKLAVDRDDVHITADTEEVAQLVEEKLKEMLYSANLHTIKLEEMMPLESTTKGVLIINCMDGTSVSATGPKQLRTSLENALDMRHKKEDALVQETETDPVKCPNKKSKREESEFLVERQAPPTTKEEVFRSEGTVKSRRRGLKSDKPQSKTTPKTTSNTEPVGTEGMKTFKSQKTGVLVKIGQSDITKIEVDAIVNAANEDLEHIGGVARAIAEAAGPGFERECKEVLQKRKKKLQTADVCVTGAGSMPARKVLHAVGPAVDNYDEESEAFDVLRDTFSNCLIEAQNENCQSVAIPAISSGNFGIPMEKVAEMASQALEDFLATDRTNPVHLVIFTDVRSEMIEFFEKKMKRLVRGNILTTYVGSGSTV